jgi:hypothetical protein
VANDHSRLGVKGVEQADHVANEVEESILIDRVRAITLAIAAHVRRHDMEAGLSQRRELVAPGIPALWEAVTEEDKRPYSLLSDMHAQAIGLDYTVLYLSHDDLQYDSRSSVSLPCWSLAPSL